MMRFESFAHGLILSVAASAVSLAVALWGFGRMYYLAVMLPVFMAFYVLLAWLVYLKKTSFRGFNPETTGAATDIPEDKVSGAELTGRRDKYGLVPRRPDLQDNRVETLLKNPIPALLWSACQLAVLATVLYSAFGIGARYH
ncbi:MAG: hypothetical protein ACOX5M_02915 [Bacillota bacterium]